MEWLFYIYALVCFGHVTGFLPLHPIENLGCRLSCSGWRLLGKFVTKMGGCSICQCHMLCLLYLLIGGGLFVHPWWYVISLGLSYMTMFGIGLLRLLYDLCIGLLSCINKRL